MKTMKVRRAAAAVLLSTTMTAAQPALAESCNPLCAGGLHGGQSHVWPTGGQGYGGNDVGGYTGAGGGGGQYGGGGWGLAGVGGCGGNLNGALGFHTNGSGCP